MWDIIIYTAVEVRTWMGNYIYTCLHVHECIHAYTHTYIFPYDICKAQGIPYKPRSHRQVYIARCGRRTHDPWVFDTTTSKWLASALMQWTTEDKTKIPPPWHMDQPATWLNLTGTKSVILELGPASSDQKFSHIRYAQAQGILYKLWSYIQGRVARCGRRTHDPWVYDTTLWWCVIVH